MTPDNALTLAIFGVGVKTGIFIGIWLVYTLTYTVLFIVRSRQLYRIREFLEDRRLVQEYHDWIKQRPKTEWVLKKEVKDE